ncbi:hypothetical protein LINPERPRIM_LOCUS4250 [Linum perenne]
MRTTNVLSSRVHGKSSTTTLRWADGRPISMTKHQSRKF